MRRAARQLAIQLAVVVLVLAPWLIRNGRERGSPKLTTIAGLGLWGSHNEWTFRAPGYAGDWVRTSELERAFGELPAGEVAKDRQAWRRGAAAIEANLHLMPRLVAWKLARFVWPFPETPNTMARWAFALGWIAIAPFVLIGGWLALRRRPGLMMIPLLPVLATIATVMLFYGSVRMRDSIAPLLVAAAAIGVTAAAAKVMPQWFAAVDADEDDATGARGADDEATQRVAA